MKGQTTIFTAVASILAIGLGLSIFAPSVKVLGDVEEQKMLYLSHDLELIIETASFLPEDSNYLLPDFLPNTTVELRQQQLFIKKGNTERSPELNLPNNITAKETKVPLEYVYVVRSGDIVYLSQSISENCLKIHRSSKELTITELDNSQKTKDFVNNLKDILKNDYRISSNNGIKISVELGTLEEISVGKGANREHVTMSCFIQQSTGLKEYQEINRAEIIIRITDNTERATLVAKIKEGVDNYYE